MKKASAELTALTVLSIVLVSMMFTALRDTRVTGLASYDNDTDYGTQSLCGGAVPCDGCGYTVTSNATLPSNLVCSGTALIIGDDDITLDCNGSTITGDQTLYGIYINNYNTITIKNCTITNFTDGIRVESSNYNLIEENNLSDNSRGIYVSQGNYAEIVNNNLIGNQAYAFYLDNISNTKIGYNYVKDNNPRGIYMVYSDDNNITNNDLNNNTNSGISLTYSNRNNVLSNNVSESDECIALSNSVNNTILHNRVTITAGNSYGINLYAGSSNEVRNNTFSGSDGVSLYVYQSSRNRILDNSIPVSNNQGIYLRQSSNNLVRNNTASSSLNTNGIHLLDSDYNNITLNIANSNNANGLYMDNSNGCLIDQNNFSGNTQHGIIITDSHNNTLFDNTIPGNMQRGVQISQSTGINLTGNEILNHGFNNGLILQNTNHSFIIDNEIDANYEGILLGSSSTNNTIKSNLVINSTSYGIHLDTSSENTIENNNVSYNNPSGIYLENSDSNIVKENTANNNSVHGIIINSSSSNNNISLNTADNNTQNGISLDDADDNTISENNVSGNYNGILLSLGADDNNITENFVKNSTYTGIRLADCLNNRVTGNNVTKNGNSISLGNNANHTIVSENKIYSNGEGLYIRWASNNLLINNTVYDNTNYGVLLHAQSEDNNVTNNTIEGSDIGIGIDGDRSIITGNTIKDNDVGLSLTYSSARNNSIYDNYLDNPDNLDNLATNNDFNTTRTSGVNIIGKSYIGGNYWGNYKGQDVDGDWLGDTRIPHELVDYHPLTYNSAAMLDIFELNSSHGANTTNENLTCWANATDYDRDNLTYHGFWYLNGTEQVKEIWNHTFSGIFSGSDVEGFGVSADNENNLFVVGYQIVSGDKQKTIWKYDSSGIYVGFSTPLSAGEDYELFGIDINDEGEVFAAGYYGDSFLPKMIVEQFNNSLSNVGSFEFGGASYVTIAQSVAIDYNDNVIVAGYSNKTGDYDFVIFKLDENLNEIWNITLDLNGNNDYAMAAAIDNSDNIIITGRTENSTTNNYDFLTAKYYPNGTQIWNKTFNKSIGDRAYGVAIDSNDNIIVAGRTEGTGQDILVVMYNSTGNETWNKTISGSGDEYAKDVAIDTRDYITIGALTTSVGAGQQDFYIIKLNSSGNHIWNYTFGGSDNDVLYGITADKKDNIIAVGSTKSLPTTSSNWSMLTVKYGGFESAEYEPQELAEAGILDYSETNVYDTWNCELAIYDGNEYGFYNMSNGLTIIPDTAPTWSNNITAPPSPATYSPGQSYQFNVSWQNNIYVDIVYIEHNFNGTLWNYTVTDHNVDEFYYNYSNLTVGSYVWKEYANDTAGIWNETDQWTYDVQKATQTCDVAVNESEITYGQLVNVTCSCNGEGTTNLFQDNGSTITDITSQIEQAILLGKGNYTFICNSSATQNYTSAKNESNLINVSKAASVVNLLINGIDGDVEANVNSIVNITAYLVTGEGNITLYENTTLLNESSAAIEHLKNYTTITLYNITVNYTETENYTFSSESHNLTIKDITEPIWSNNKTSPVSGNVYVYNQSYQFNVTWTDTHDQIANVTIEHNFNGSVENYSVNANVSSEYYYNYSDIGTGIYSWTECANDTLGNLGCSDSFSYTVSMASQTCSLSFNPTSMTDGQTVNVGCSCTGEESPKLYRNGNDVTSEIGTDVALAEGVYEYVCNVSQTQNYTSASNESNFTVSSKPSSGGGSSSSRCSSECTYGERACGAGNEVFVCGDYDSDICMEWTSFACRTDEKCENGECVPAVCVEDWLCDVWSSCQQGYNVRDCYDFNSCGTYKTVPKTKIECEEPAEEIVDEEELYIPPETGIETEQETLVEEQQPIFTSTTVAKAVGLGALGIAVILIIVGIIGVAKGGVTGLIKREIDKGFPESRIKHDVVKKGYSQEEAGNIVKQEEIRKLSSIITANINHGFSIRDIRSELISKGWKKELVEEAVNNLGKK